MQMNATNALLDEFAQQFAGDPCALWNGDTLCLRWNEHEEIHVAFDQASNSVELLARCGHGSTATDGEPEDDQWIPFNLLPGVHPLVLLQHTSTDDVAIVSRAPLEQLDRQCLHDWMLHFIDSYGWLQGRFAGVALPGEPGAGSSAVSTALSHEGGSFNVFARMP
jgi:hypothetical protein